MPIYEYHCTDCNNKFEKRRSMSQADAEILCPQCGGDHTIRGLSRFAAFSKGSGGATQAVSGGGECGGCGSRTCGSCARH